jgi:hypothetical protein
MNRFNGGGAAADVQICESLNKCGIVQSARRRLAGCRKNQQPEVSSNNAT